MYFLQRGVGLVKNKKWIQTLTVIGIYFIFYFISTISNNEFWGNILSPIGALLSFVIILHTYFKSDRTQNIQKSWIFLALSCFSWAVADILWVIYEPVFHQNPENSDLIAGFYLGTNVLLFIAILIYAGYKTRRWNAIQLIVDSIAIAASCIFLFWILFLDKNIKTFDLISNGGWINTLTVICDVVASVGIIIWFCSVREGEIPVSVRFVAGSALLYFIVDILWIYEDAREIYISNSVIDAVYMASLLGISLGARMQTVSPKALDLPDTGYSNVSMKQGTKLKGLVILCAPILTIILKGFILKDLLIFLFIILIYQLLTVYIQASIRNQQLLIKVQGLNYELENRIAVRTKELEEKNKQLDFLSNQDTLTSLYNRRYFLHAIEETFSKMVPNETLALLFVDLDRFKTINDIYGHDVGDKILVEVSKRLQEMNLQNAFLARLGGDEFVLAFHSAYKYQDMERIARQIIDTCSKVIEIGRYCFRLTLSIGISIYPLDAKDINMLLKNADMAMYQAKKIGYNRFVSFNQQIKEIIQRKNEIEMMLKQVDFDKEFDLFYQPQFCIPDKKLIGMEALLRWNSPQKGFIPPDEFIPIAEETDDIIAIGDWVIKKAVRQIENWNRVYGLELKVAINVSPKQFEQTNFSGELQCFMKYCSVIPKWVDIEITESVAMGGKYQMSEIAEQLKNEGVSISIDDFGTGYSSLSYLKLFPFDRIKIAQPLIDAITIDNYDLNITKFIINLAKSIGIKTIAEGVETKEQFDLLTELGCEQIQGFYLGKPVPNTEFEELFLKCEITT